ncbi:MAG: class I SAM-dependent methyltransferase [Natrialbaceae archaeon]|nr:class I SAM-dependent methyltransferase [Natrialbaceae archaeon]
MGSHTFDISGADRLENAADRYRYLSEEELLALVEPEKDAVLADIGSGTGFYTDSIAGATGTVLALDIQPSMHAYYQEKGLPSAVQPVVTTISTLPISTDALDGAFSTMTYHEFEDEAALAELARTITPGGRLVIVDWSTAGTGSAGPPLEERRSLESATRATRGRWICRSSGPNRGVKRGYSLRFGDRIRGEFLSQKTAAVFPYAIRPSL